MLGFRLLVHSLRQLFGKIPAVLRLSLIPALIFFGFQLGPVLIYGPGRVTLSGSVAALLLVAMLPFAALVNALMSWSGTLIGLSVMTTLWGHFVERRALR